MPNSVKAMMDTANAAVPRISADDAEALIKSGKAVVVDVREMQELQATGKVPGALHIPRGMLEFKADPAMPSHDKALDKSKTIILYCASGGRSALAGKLLKDLGYSDVRNLGGLKDWAEAGKDIERI